MEANKIIQYLREICAIPHESKDEQALAEFLMAFAKERNLETFQDVKGNVLIKKPAVGCVGKEAVILQGHLDMVYVKAEESNHKYEEGIKVLEDEEFLFADGTSLGADNGIAIAYCMMLMDSKDIVHPDLEMIFTVEEEVGLAGAGAFDVTGLKGRKFINIDSEEEGIFCASCAGAVRAGLSWELKKEELCGAVKRVVVEISGLKGGHSGMNIDMGRANAIQLMGRILYELNQTCDYRIEKIQIPGKANAIPNYAKAVLCAEGSQTEVLENVVRNLEKQFQNEHEVTDTISVSVSVEDADGNQAVYEKDLNKRIANAIMMVPNGVMSYSEKVEGLVETSMNMGFLEEQGDRLYMLSSVRSAVDSKKYFIRNKMSIIADMYCDNVEFLNDYPGWQYVAESEIRELACDIYRKIAGKEAEVQAIHAGLECGFWYHKNPEFDLISIGPDLFDVHSVNERVSKKSIANTWEFLKEILKNI